MIGNRASLAIAQVVGCRVIQARGDQAVVTGLLDCGGKARRRGVAPQSTGALDCVLVNHRITDANGVPYLEYEYDPI